jgi:beta-glucanase (GH16 family)
MMTLQSKRSTARAICCAGVLAMCASAWPCSRMASAETALEAPLPVLKEGADKWQLTWRDEFDGTEADLDKRWESQNGPSGHILCSRWRENARVENGTLKLLNRKESRGGQNWTSGNIWTRDQFQYGYFECRYRYAAAPATNNSFWIMTRKEQSQVQSAPGFAATRPARGAYFEIDINEGHYPATVNTNIHNWSDLIEVNGQKRSRSDARSHRLGIQPDRVVQLETPVTTRKVRFVSTHPKHFHIREFRVFGAKPEGGYPDLFKPVPKDGPADLARDPKNRITVSGLYAGPLQPGMTNNVGNLTDNNPGTAWISQPEGEKSIEIEFPEPRTIGCVQFLNGWTAGPKWEGAVDNYKVQYHNGTDWVDMSSFDFGKLDQDFARDYNVFGLEWNETDLIFYLNGKEIRRAKNEFCHSPAPVWLSLAIIAWHGKVTDAIDGTFMEVDYVRVFNRKP